MSFGITKEPILADSVLVTQTLAVVALGVGKRARGLEVAGGAASVAVSSHLLAEVLNGATAWGRTGDSGGVYVHGPGVTRRLAG